MTVTTSLGTPPPSLSTTTLSTQIQPIRTMLVILIIVCAINLILLAVTCALLNYIAKRRGRCVLTKDLEGQQQQGESGRTLRPGHSCVTLGSEGVYVMPSNLMSPPPKWTPFGATRKSVDGPPISLDASTFLSSTVTSLNSSQNSFGATLNGFMALNAQLEALQKQSGEQRTSTKVSTDLGAALDQVLAKHGGGQGTSFNSHSGNSQMTAGTQESGYGSGFNSHDLGKALEQVLNKHNYNHITQLHNASIQKEKKTNRNTNKSKVTFVNTW